MTWKIIMIGSGNVATILGRKILAAGHTILQVFGRRELHAKALANEFVCGYTSSWAGIDRDADLYIAALSDQALTEMAAQLTLPGKFIVHTAGAVPMNILQTVSPRCGVLYPLQSLSTEVAAPVEIPLLLDAGNTQDLGLLDEFARTCSPLVRRADDTTRLKLHVAAVFVNNFTNHLHVLTERYCREEGMDFRLLLPLIHETASRLEETSPQLLQTGPAARNDLETVKRHLSQLEPYPEMRNIYEIMTGSIQRLAERHGKSR